MSFIKSFLGYDNLHLTYKRDDIYDFRVFDSAQEMHDLIREKDMEARNAKASETGKSLGDISGSCRVVAGYCYEWNTKNGGSKGQDRAGSNFDIILDSGQYKAKWNLRHPGLPNDYSWLNDPLSVDEVGCIHTCQGLDLNYLH